MTAQILLVDDNLVQAQTRCMVLSRSGFKVTIAQSAREAVSMLERSELQASIRLLVTDHLMPEMNGTELVRLLRITLPDLPILVLSGLAEAEGEYASYDVSFQLKPFPPEELIRLTNLLIGNPTLRSA